MIDMLNFIACPESWTEGQNGKSKNVCRNLKKSLQVLLENDIIE